MNIGLTLAEVNGLICEDCRKKLQEAIEQKISEMVKRALEKPKEG